MNYLEKQTWQRYQRLCRAYRREVDPEKAERARYKLDSFVLTLILLSRYRKKSDVGTTKE